MSLTTEGKPRIESLDVLRGFAVLGILIVNAAYFAGGPRTAFVPHVMPLAVDDSSVWSWLLMHVLFEFKCITLFSMLFGASIYLVGGEFGDKQRGPLLWRRLFWLAVFGLIHGVLLWYGDISLNYAIAGVFVIFMRSWKPWVLLVLGLVLVGVSAWLIAHPWLESLSTPRAELLEQERNMLLTPEQFARLQGAMTGDIASVFDRNYRWWVPFMFGSLKFMTVRTVGVMMIGLALFKWGFLSGRSPAWLYRLFLALGLVAFAVLLWSAWRGYTSEFPTRDITGFDSIVNQLLSPFGTLFYISLLILTLKSGAVRWLMDALAATGRMAFTNYIAQSVIMTGIFWGGRGFGLFGQFDRVELTLLVFGIWIVQLIWSPLWLRYFAMGPLEWLWRSLTYMRLVPIRGTAAAMG
jgi:uncharacterized protein